MSPKETKMNKTILRVFLAAAAVLLFCGAAVGAVGATDFPGPGNVPAGTYTGGNLQKGTYTLQGNVTLGTKGLTVPNGVSCTIDLNGYELDARRNFSVITVISGGYLTLEDSGTGGKITMGSGGRGGGVYVEGGTFTMSGGSIYANEATVSGGGGVYVASGGTFTMSGGSITKNTASQGSIGGGVYVASGGTFTMSGGSITENSATSSDGGGVYVADGGIFTMSVSASITGNTAASYKNGGGVYVAGGTFNVCGAPTITGNKQGASKAGTINNVWLADGKLITVTGPLTSGADIRIKYPESGEFAQGVNADTSKGQVEYTVTNTDGKYFHPDSNPAQVAKVLSAEAKGAESKLQGWYEILETVVTFNTVDSTIVKTYPKAEVFTLPAVPTKTGDAFLGWIDGSGKFFCAYYNGAYLYLNPSDYYDTDKKWTYSGATITLTAAWARTGPGPAAYTVTATAGTGGSVSVSPTSPAAPGTSVTLTAAPASGYHFKQWVTAGLSSAVSTTNPLPFIMPSNDVSAVAEFEADAPAPETKYNVTVSSGGNGKAYASLTSAASGTQITITAYPDTGYKFSSWTVTGATVSSETANPATFTIGSSDVTVSAAFEEDQTPGPTYTVTAAAGAGGSITDAPTNPVAPGTSVTITAAAESGYHFKEWNNISGLPFSTSKDNPLMFYMPNSQVSVEASFEADPTPAKSQTVIFLDANGGVNGTNNVTATKGESTLAAINNPAKTGYTFNGFYTEKSGGVMVIDSTGALQASTAYTDAEGKWTSDAKTLILYAQWTENQPPATHSITVTTDGKGNAAASADSAKTGDTISLAQAAGDGYRFKEWQIKSPLAGLTIENNRFTMPDEPVEITAVFEVISKTVTPAPDGTADINSPAVPFSDGGGASVISATNIDGDLTYTAKVEDIPPQRAGYTQIIICVVDVTANLKDQGQPSLFTADATLPGDNLRNYVCLEHKNTDETWTRISPTVEGGDALGNHTFRYVFPLSSYCPLAIVVEEPEAYTVTFDKNGGDTEADPKVIEETYDTKYTLPTTNPTKSGSNFAGWFTDATEGTQVTTATVVQITADATLYAHWSNIPVYKITYKAGDGSGADVEDPGHASGSSVTLKAADTFTAPAGKVFDQWSDGTTTYDAGAAFTMPGNDVTMTAQWKDAPAYTISITQPTGGSISTTPSGSAYAGQEVSLTFTAAAGKALDAWSVKETDGGADVTVTGNKFTMPAKAVTVTATVKDAPAYTVTFDLRGHGDNFTETVNPGDKVTRPSPDPSAIGCIFGGWYTDSGCTPGNEWDFDTPVPGDMTIYAKWEIVSYTAKVDDYIFGGTVPTPKVIPEGPADVSFFYIREGQAYSWDTLTSITLDAGSYYVRAVDNTGAVEIKDSSFTVNKAEQVKPDIRVEAVTGGIETTITNYLSGYTYLYSLDAKNWELVPAGSSSFTIPGLDAETPYTVAVKINAKDNYKERISDSKTVTTLGTFSVSYNANGGVGTIEPQSATKGDSITVASSSGISRNGYTFTVWTTNPDGTGDSFRAGVDPISYGAVLYAQWEAQTYTISFDAHGGDVTPLSKTVRYGEPYSLPTATHQGNQTFSGWAVSKNGSVMYAGGQQVKDLGDITLHAVWANKTFGLTVNVQKEDSSSVDGATVTLKLGSAEFREPASSSSGTAYFGDVPEGNYTLVAEKDGKTVTVAVSVPADQNAEVIFPAVDVSSIVQIEDGTPAVAVNGLAETAADSAKDGNHVDVTVTVETKTEGAPASGNPDDQETQIEIKQINDKVPAGSKTEYLGINIEKQVSEGTPEKLTSTANMLEFLIPYDFNGKFSVTLYRCHNGEVTPLTEIKQKYGPDAKREDGKYYLDTANGMIYLYSSQFSTYGVNYVSSDSPTPSRSSSTPQGSSVWITATPTPTVTPTPAPMVTQTPEMPQVKPIEQKPAAQTGASPAPVMGVIAGLGCAAVVFGLRRK